MMQAGDEVHFYAEEGQLIKLKLKVLFFGKFPAEFVQLMLDLINKNVEIGTNVSKGDEDGYLDSSSLLLLHCIVVVTVGLLWQYRLNVIMYS